MLHSLVPQVPGNILDILGYPCKEPNTPGHFLKDIHVDVLYNMVETVDIAVLYVLQYVKWYEQHCSDCCTLYMYVWFCFVEIVFWWRWLSMQWIETMQEGKESCWHFCVWVRWSSNSLSIHQANLFSLANKCSDTSFDTQHHAGHSIHHSTCHLYPICTASFCILCLNNIDKCRKQSIRCAWFSCV